MPCPAHFGAQKLATLNERPKFFLKICRRTFFVNVSLPLEFNIYFIKP